MRTILMAVLSVVVVGAAHADVLWGKAESGDSVSTIAAAYPEGTEVVPTEKQRLKSGAMLRFKIERIEIAGKEFDASFYFLDDKLTQVSLAHKSAESTYGCESTLDSLQEALRAKYGKELTNSRNSRLGISRGASWASGKTTINLSMYAFDTPSCHVHVAYSERLAGIADKL